MIMFVQRIGRLGRTVICSDMHQGVQKHVLGLLFVVLLDVWKTILSLGVPRVGYIVLFA